MVDNTMVSYGLCRNLLSEFPVYDGTNKNQYVELYRTTFFDTMVDSHCVQDKGTNQC